jgi:hypothetical protein
MIRKNGWGEIASVEPVDFGDSPDCADTQVQV